MVCPSTLSAHMLSDLRTRISGRNYLGNDVDGDCVAVQCLGCWEDGRACWVDFSDDESAHIEAAWQAGATDLILDETYAIHFMPATRQENLNSGRFRTFVRRIGITPTVRTQDAHRDDQTIVRAVKTLRVCASE